MQRSTWPQYLLTSVLLLALIIDGLDMQLLSLVSPLLLSEWGVNKAALGPALSAAMVGMSGGAMLGGWLGDRWGRKFVLVGSVFCFGTATLAVAFAGNLDQVTGLRVLGGIGFGAAAPNAVALASEWLGRTLRTKAISLLSIGAPLGGMMGAILLIGLLSSLGWRGSFILCGLLALLIMVVIAAVVPESPSYLLARGHTGRLAALRERWGGAELDAESLASAEDVVAHAVPVAAQTAPVSRRFFYGSSLAFFSISFVAYACAAWTPLLVTQSGLSLVQGLGAVFWFNLCAVLAAVLAGFLVPFMGSRCLMLLGATLAGVASVLFLLLLGPGDLAARTTTGLWIAVVAGMAGAGTATVLATVYMVLAAGYPPLRRSTGLGLGMMLGRAGGIFSTFFGGRLLGATPQDSAPFFMAMLVGVVGTFVGILLVDRHLVARSPTAEMSR
jgi:AAHS family 4-hydroxybenzoate transporter-like MFS transporter